MVLCYIFIVTNSALIFLDYVFYSYFWEYMNIFKQRIGLDYWSNYIIFSVALLLSMGIAITHNCYRWLYLFSSDRIIRSEAMIS